MFVLSCIDKGLVTGRSPYQRVQLSVKLILSREVAKRHNLSKEEEEEEEVTYEYLKIAYVATLRYHQHAAST
jgi:hypothetical protein